MAKSTKLDGWTTATKKGKKGTTVQSEWKRRMDIKKLSEEIEKAKKKDEKMDIQMESEIARDVQIKQEIIDDSNTFSILSDSEEEEDGNEKKEDHKTYDDYEIEIMSDDEDDGGNKSPVNVGNKEKVNEEKSATTDSNNDKYNSTDVTATMLNALDDMENENNIKINQVKNDDTSRKKCNNKKVKATMNKNGDDDLMIIEENEAKNVNFEEKFAPDKKAEKYQNEEERESEKNKNNKDDNRKKNQPNSRRRNCI